MMGREQKVRDTIIICYSGSSSGFKGIIQERRGESEVGGKKGGKGEGIIWKWGNFRSEGKWGSIYRREGVSLGVASLFK